jgi:hypothetical protein
MPVIPHSIRTAWATRVTGLLLLGFGLLPAVELITVPQPDSAPKFIREEKAGAVTYTGLAPEMMAAITRLDPELRFILASQEEVTLARILDLLAQGKIACEPGMSKTEERVRKYPYSAMPLWTMRYVVAVRSDDAEARTAQSLADIARLGGTMLTVRESASKTVLLQKPRTRA